MVRLLGRRVSKEDGPVGTPTPTPHKQAEEEEAEGEEDSPTTFDTDSVDTLIDEMKAAHDRAMKNLIETSNSRLAKNAPLGTTWEGTRPMSIAQQHSC